MKRVLMIVCAFMVGTILAAEEKPFDPVARLTVMPDAETAAFCASAAARVAVEGHKDILFLGDSLTDFDRDRNHASMLAYYLEKAHPGAFTVYNYAIGGDFCKRLCDRMNGRKSYRLEAFANIWSRSYDWAFVFLGANDTKTSSGNDFKVPSTPPERQEKEMGEIIALLQKHGVSRIILISPAVANWTRCQEVAQQRLKTGKRVSRFGEPKHLEAFAAVCRQLAEKTAGVEFLDLYTPMKARADVSEMTRDDGVHLVDKGYRFVACRLFEYLADGGFAAGGQKTRSGCAGCSSTLRQHRC